MKYLTFLLVLAAGLVGCTNAQTPAQASEPVRGTVNPKAPLRQDPADKDRSEPGLVIRMGEATVAPGQEACLPVEVSNFKDLLAFQYTLRYDSAALRYTTVRNFNLNGYRKDNFGDRFADRGYLSTLWTSPDIVNGNTLSDNHPLYEVCFENLQPSGQSAEVKFQNGPTAFEVIGPGMVRWRLVYANGKVTSK